MISDADEIFAPPKYNNIVLGFITPDDVLAVNNDIVLSSLNLFICFHRTFVCNAFIIIDIMEVGTLRFHQIFTLVV